MSGRLPRELGRSAAYGAFAAARAGGRVVGWAAAGGIIGRAVAHRLPDLPRKPATIGGALGGVLGCAVLILVAPPESETAWTRLLGAAVVGFAIGATMIVLDAAL